MLFLLNVKIFLIKEYSLRSLKKAIVRFLPTVSTLVPDDADLDIILSKSCYGSN